MILLTSLEKRFFEDDVLPSARLPGALEIDPFVRKLVANSGMFLSEDALWMLVVAVRVHATALIKKIIATSKDLDHGYASHLPKSSMITLTCEHQKLEKDGQTEASSQKDEKARVQNGGRKRGRKVIDSNDLSHVLAANPSLAGGSISWSSSRFAWMNSVSHSDAKRMEFEQLGLENANCIINAALERAASKRQRISPGDQNFSLTQTTVPSLGALSAPNNVNASTQILKRLQKMPNPTAQPLPMSAPFDKSISNAKKRGRFAPPPRRSSSSITSVSGHSKIFPLPQKQLESSSERQSRTHSEPIVPLMPKWLGAKNKEQNTLPSNAQCPKPEMRVLELSIPEPAPKLEPSQKTESVQNPVPPPKLTAQRRGSKNLAAMMARSTSKSKVVSNETTSADDKKNFNGATLKTITASSYVSSITSDEQNDECGGKNDTKEGSKPPDISANAALLPRGRGVKNLSAMKARSSFTES